MSFVEKNAHYFHFVKEVPNNSEIRLKVRRSDLLGSFTRKSETHDKNSNKNCDKREGLKEGF